MIVGLYSQLLPEPCTKNTPENPHFKDRYDQVYYGLSTEEALWLVSSLGHFIMTLVNLKSPIKRKNFIFNFIQFKGKQ